MDNRSFSEKAHDAGYDNDEGYVKEIASGCSSILAIPFLILIVVCAVGSLVFYLDILPNIMTNIICNVSRVCY